MTIKLTATSVAVALLSLTAVPATATIIYDGSTLPRGDSDYY